jgi:nucleoside-diphosphate-sugar epimerase
MHTHTILITGGVGYVGAMLCERFAARPDVARIIAVDKEAAPEPLAHNPKIEWITANLADGSWIERARQANPDIVIHTAWQIREMYGKKKLQWRWNVEGSDAVFDFALGAASVKKLVYFSTASIYGAFSDNTLEHRFTEDEPLREDEYLYGVEKKAAEERLRAKYAAAAAAGSAPQVFIVRPAAITGPRGRFMRVRFGLQSALSGHLKGSFIYGLVSMLTSRVPATPLWCRQFIHEDDVTDIVELLSFSVLPGALETFNITPPGSPVLAPDMARAVGKRTIAVPPWLIRIAFFWFWHLTRGRIPTSRGGWKFYSYPIVMDGEKLTRLYGYRYRYDAHSAFTKTAGRYESYVPREHRS